jgi:hypothetical protein
MDCPPIFKNKPSDHPLRGDDAGAVPLAPRNVKDLMHEQGIEISQETVQFAPKYFGLLRSSVN